MTDVAGAGNATLIAPPRPPRRTTCGFGVTPCGASGRLYLQGIRCDNHAPDKERNQ